MSSCNSRLTRVRPGHWVDGCPTFCKEKACALSPPPPQKHTHLPYICLAVAAAAEDVLPTGAEAGLHTEAACPVSAEAGDRRAVQLRQPVQVVAAVYAGHQQQVTWGGEQGEGEEAR